jgi:hypothetical protein
MHFTIRTSREIFSPEELAVLNRYGAYFERLNRVVAT